MSKSAFHKTVAAIAMAISFGACQPAPPTPTTVTVDPRIELIGVVQYLAGYTLSTRYDFHYKSEVEEHFSVFRDHEAVTIFQTMSSQGFSFDVVPRTMLSLTDPPELSNKYEAFPSDVLASVGGQERLESFMAALRDFAVQTDFTIFFDNHENFYDSLTTSATPTMIATVRALEEYLGDSVSDSHVILGVLFHHGGFSTLFETERFQEAYALIGPAGGDGSYPGFGAARRLGSIAWHEFSHTIINDITDEHREWLNSNDHLYEPIADEMAQRGYTTWETVVNEHLIRAITSRMLSRNLGPSVGLSAMNSDIQMGFVYLTSLNNALQRYEENRDTYSSITEFFPELLEAFLEEIESTEPGAPEEG
jgi:hypothetical protein